MIRDSRQRVENAFHGTTQAAAHEIVKGSFKLPEADDVRGAGDKWFGRGIYFYDGDPEAARYWPRPVPEGTPLAVIQSKVKMGVMFDVQTFEAQDLMEQAALKMRSAPNVRPEEVDDFSVIDFLAKALDLDTGSRYRATDTLTELDITQLKTASAFAFDHLRQKGRNDRRVEYS